MTGVGVTSDEGLEPVFEVGWQELSFLGESERRDCFLLDASQ